MHVYSVIFLQITLYSSLFDIVISISMKFDVYADRYINTCLLYIITPIVFNSSPWNIIFEKQLILHFTRGRNGSICNNSRER
jgi:hypothetical protein